MWVSCIDLGFPVITIGDMVNVQSKLNVCWQSSLNNGKQKNIDTNHAAEVTEGRPAGWDGS